MIIFIHTNLVPTNTFLCRLMVELGSFLACCKFPRFESWAGICLLSSWSPSCWHWKIIVSAVSQVLQIQQLLLAFEHLCIFKSSDDDFGQRCVHTDWTIAMQHFNPSDLHWVNVDVFQSRDSCWKTTPNSLTKSGIPGLLLIEIQWLLKWCGYLN